MIHTEHTRVSDFIDTNYQCHLNVYINTSSNHITKHLLTCNSQRNAFCITCARTPEKQINTVNTKASINRNVETKPSPMQVLDLKTRVCVFVYSSISQQSLA